MSNCWSGTFKSPLLCLHFATGRLLYGLGFAKIPHDHVVPDHDTTELLLYTASCKVPDLLDEFLMFFLYPRQHTGEMRQHSQEGKQQTFIGKLQKIRVLSKF